MVGAVVCSSSSRSSGAGTSFVLSFFDAWARQQTKKKKRRGGLFTRSGKWEKGKDAQVKGRGNDDKVETE